MFLGVIAGKTFPDFEVYTSSEIPHPPQKGVQLRSITRRWDIKT